MLSAVEKATNDEAGEAIEAVKADVEARKEKVRARVQKWREKQKPETLRNVTERNETLRNGLRDHVTRVEDNLQTKKISGKTEKIDSCAKSAIEAEFSEVFWPEYPLKKGKQNALKAFIAARKRSDLETIMAGVRRYATERAGQDQQYTKHPQGWLNGGHWSDEATPQPTPRAVAASPPRQRTMNDAIKDLIAGKLDVSIIPRKISDDSRDRGGSADAVQLLSDAARH
jgi:hypothetical protein